MISYLSTTNSIVASNKNTSTILITLWCNIYSAFIKHD